MEVGAAIETGKSFATILKDLGLWNILGSVVSGAIVGLFFVLLFMRNSATQFKFFKKEFLELKAKVAKIETTYQGVLGLSGIVKFLQDNLSLFTGLAETLRPSVAGIFEFIDNELRLSCDYIRENYKNGSKRRTTGQTMDLAYTKIIENLSEYKLETGLMNIITVYADVMMDLVADLVPRLEYNKDDPELKAIVINRYFQNLRTLLNYCKIMQSVIKEMPEDELKSWMKTYFASIDFGSKMDADREERHQKALAALRGFESRLAPEKKE